MLQSEESQNSKCSVSSLFKDRNWATWNSIDIQYLSIRDAVYPDGTPQTQDSKMEVCMQEEYLQGVREAGMGRRRGWPWWGCKWSLRSYHGQLWSRDGPWKLSGIEARVCASVLQHQPVPGCLLSPGRDSSLVQAVTEKELTFELVGANTPNWGKMNALFLTGDPRSPPIYLLQHTT